MTCFGFYADNGTSRQALVAFNSRRRFLEQPFRLIIAVLTVSFAYNAKQNETPHCGSKPATVC